MDFGGPRANEHCDPGKLKKLAERVGQTLKIDLQVVCACNALLSQTSKPHPANYHEARAAQPFVRGSLCTSDMKPEVLSDLAVRGSTVMTRRQARGPGHEPL
jgi:hypothetical protein